MNSPCRYSMLLRFQASLELPMIVLAFVWLALFIVKNGVRFTSCQDSAREVNLTPFR